MATVSFFGDQNQLITNLSGSGLGFFGSTFGNSVAVNAYQDTTWITNGNGTTQGAQCNNMKWTHPNSGSINGASSKHLLDFPNHLSTLRISFTHSSAVQTQNAKVRIFDRSNINNAASGVTTKVAEIIHPSVTQAGQLGSGDSSWLTPAGSSVIVSLVDSPGLSGVNAMAANSEAQHDWFLALSASPDSIGSKTLYGLYFEVEYF